MKKIYILLVMIFLSAGTFAQIAGVTPTLRKPLSIPSMPHGVAPRTTSNIWLSYDTADAYNFNQTESYFIWQMNEHYSLAAKDRVDSGGMNYCVVRFDSLYDLYTLQAIDPSTITNISIDSIYAIFGQENNSLTNDTLIVRIVNLDGTGYPGTTTLWADTAITDSSWSTGGNWLMSTAMQWNPAYAANIKSFGIQLQYYGDKHDTCGFLAGFNGTTGTGACAGDEICDAESNFWPNSYAYWVSQSMLLPTSTGGDIYYNCTGAGGGGGAGNGYNYIQDILIGAWVTINPPVGVKEELKNTGIALYQNAPNPLHSFTNVTYQLANDAKDVALYVYDIVGKQVMEVTEGTKASGKYTIPIDGTKLAKGIYTYTLRADGSQLTKRMIVE